MKTVFIDGIEYIPKEIPKPKTIVVELLVEDVKYWASYASLTSSGYHKQSSELYKACRQALEREGIK